MRLAFEKWEGLGNDFLLVHDSDVAPGLDPELARRLCDRRLGVGGDGVLLVRADAPRMIVINADGSRPEMCGNGLRCVAALLADGADRDFTVATDAGPRRARVRWTTPGEASVEVEMGRATIGEAFEHDAAGRKLAFTSVNVGNPHAITFEPVEAGARDLFGPLVERAIAGGTNVEFAEPSNELIELVVWERGVGYTQACGTGACATAALACTRGLAPFDAPVRVRLPGGELSISVSRDLDIRMTGPARRAFVGTVDV